MQTYLFRNSVKRHVIQQYEQGSGTSTPPLQRSLQVLRVATRLQSEVKAISYATNETRAPRRVSYRSQCTPEHRRLDIPELSGPFPGGLQAGPSIRTREAEEQLRVQLAQRTLPV